MLFALLLAARADRRGLTQAEWTAAAAAIGGLGVFLVAAQPSGGDRTASAGPLGLSAAGAVGVSLLCCLIAVKVSAPRRALVLSIGGGLGVGVMDALTKTVVTRAGTHRLGIFGDVRTYLLALVGLLTFTMQQNAFRAPPRPSGASPGSPTR